MSAESNREYLEQQQQVVRDQYKSADGDDGYDGNKIFYLNHNMEQNFQNANASKDGGMRRDILISEISKLILARPAEVQDALRQYFPNASVFSGSQLSSKALAGYVSDGLYNSKAFATEISGIIGQRSSADGDQTAGGIISNVSDVVKGIGGIFGGGKKAKAKNKAQADAAAAEAAKAKALLAAQVAAMGKTKTAGSKMAFYIVGGLLVAGGIGAAIYFATKGKKTAAA